METLAAIGVAWGQFLLFSWIFLVTSVVRFAFCVLFLQFDEFVGAA